MKTRFMPLVIIFAATCLSLWGQGHTLSVPFNAEGGASSLLPYSLGSTRFQQVYTSSAFGSPISSGGFLIQGMRFRVDSGAGFDSSGYVTNLQVRMSTTSRDPGTLSSDFAQNVGANLQIVFGTSTQFFAADHSGVSPQPWSPSMTIVFTQPYLYRPTDGNLLMDLRVSGGSSFSNYFDAVDVGGDSVGSVFGNSGSPSGTPTTMGLVTQFYGTLVPEPSTWALLALGASTVLLWRTKRRH